MTTVIRKPLVVGQLAIQEPDGGDAVLGLRHTAVCRSSDVTVDIAFSVSVRDFDDSRNCRAATGVANGYALVVDRASRRC